MGLLMEVNNFCGMKLRSATLTILHLYLYCSIGLLYKVISFAHDVIKDDGFDWGSLAMYCGAGTIDLLFFIIPSGGGILAVHRDRPAFLLPFIKFNTILLGFVCFALICFFGRLIWLIVEAVIESQSVGDDIFWMIAIIVFTALLLPLLYFITSAVHTYRKRC